MTAAVIFPESSRNWQQVQVYLGPPIYEIQSSWTGSEELKQANNTLQSLPKGLKFLRAVPALESLKFMGSWVSMTWMPSGILPA